jgi:hypothetical protein
MVKYLFDKTVDLNITNYDNNAPIINNLKNNTKIVRLFMKMGANIDDETLTNLYRFNI